MCNYSFRWTKNGEEFNWHTSKFIDQQPSKGTLIFTQPNDDDQGFYQCFIENDQGVAATNMVNVRRIQLNNIVLTNRETLIVNEGGSITIPCQPYCDLPPKIDLVWMNKLANDSLIQISNPSINADPNGSLHFSEITRDDASELYVASIQSESVEINQVEVKHVRLQVINNGATIHRPPVPMYRTPQNAIGRTNDPIQLSCIYSGSPLPVVVWKKNGTVIKSSDRISLSGFHLHIKNASVHDEALYTCVVANDAVSTAIQYSIWLTIISAPQFLVEQHNVVTCTNEMVEFDCKADGIPSPKIEWTKNGVPINQAPANDRRSVINDTLIIEDVNYDDTSNYGCNASNSVGWMYNDFYLKVINMAPRILWKPENKNVFEGDSVKLYCGYYGVPQPDLSWVFEDYRSIESDDRYEIDPRGYLTIHNVVLSDAGRFACHVTNIFGVEAESAELIVLKHTKILGEPIKYLVSEGDDVTIDCLVVADPNLQFEVKWLKNYTDFEEDRYAQHSDNSLSISNLSFSDAGLFQCNASTIWDWTIADQGIIEFSIVPRPPRVQINQCEGRRVSLSVINEGNNGSPILHYRLEYNTSTSPTVWQIAVENLAANHQVYTMDLAHWATHNWRAIAINRFGESEPSEISANCSTSLGVPERNPDNVQVISNATGNLIITWDPIAESEQNGANFRYTIEWKERHTSGDNRNVIRVYNWSTSSIIIESLPAYTLYQVRVQSENELGISDAASTEILAYSGEDRLSTAPKLFSLLQIVDKQSVLVRWQPISTKDFRGVIIGYQIWIHKGEQNNRSEINVPEFTTTSLIGGLEAGTVNHMNVVAYTKLYTSPPSNTLNVQMPT